MTSLGPVAQLSSHFATSILQRAEQQAAFRLRHYARGSSLFMQGDEADCVFVLKAGAVKLVSISPDGRSHIWDILEPGRIAGMVPALIGRTHESTAVAALDTAAFVIPVEKVQTLVAGDPDLSIALMRELAGTVDSLSADIRSLCSLNVQQRLKYALAKLAERHGIVTHKGIKIHLEITHEELASLIAADRSTVTVNFNQLRRYGYVWKEGEDLVVMSPDDMALLDELASAVETGEDEAAAGCMRRLMEAGVDPVAAVDAMARGMQAVSQGFARNNLALADVLLAVDAMKRAMTALEDSSQVARRKGRSTGRVVIGTVRGDIHDIGKTIVSTLLEANGFEVIDLGVDVAAIAFIEAVAEHRPQILALSAFLTASASESGQVIDVLRAEGLRDVVKVMTGGTAMSREFADYIGADGFSSSASDAVSLARRLTRKG